MMQKMPSDATVCLTSLRFRTSPDSAATCNGNNFQIGFVDDDDWYDAGGATDAKQERPALNSTP